jgi:hypothetical protein
LVKIPIGIDKSRKTLELLDQPCWEYFFLGRGVLLPGPWGGSG